MDKVKVNAERRIEPNLQKLARALISIARRQLAEESARQAEAAAASAKPRTRASSKDSA